MTSIESRILDAIRANPGIRARDIARLLGIERTQVNAALYGSLSGQVRQDRTYGWQEREALEQRPAPGEKSNDPLARLCSYYLECLSYDDMGGVSEFADSKFGDPSYVELEKIENGIGPTSDVFASEAARGLLRRVRQDRSRSTLVLGYPVLNKLIRSRKGWEGYVVEPLLLFQFKEADARATPALSDDAPRLNPAAVLSLSNSGRSALAEELSQLTEELGLGAPAGELPELDELLARFRILCPEWPWNEDLDPTAFSHGEPLRGLNKQGVFNRAILVTTERSPYTKGLETELAQLKATSPDAYGGTALGQWIRADVPSAKSESDSRPLLEVLPLNTEQREAVTQALTKPLTVITGPPGTGKSQVVTSILINAAYRGQTVLFASKNNKAVDVVEARVNALGPRPILLRLGASEYQSKLNDFVVSLLGTTSTPDDRASFEHYEKEQKRHQDRSSALDKELDNLIQLRNDVDRLERAVEAIRHNVGETMFRGLKDLPVGELKDLLSTFQSRAVAADKTKQSVLTRLLWPLIRGGRFEALAAASKPLQQHIPRFDIQPPAVTPTSDESAADWIAFAARLEERYTNAKSVAEYFRQLDNLSRKRSLEDIASDRRHFIAQLAGNSRLLWETWLRLQPTRLRGADRKTLGNFSAVLQLLVAANTQNRAATREVLKQYNALFPRVAPILPCWAVTSLSARGRIPFEPRFVDLLVIDEASQCDIASALPLLFRARRVVVIGDPMQLRHITGLAKHTDQQLLTNSDVLSDYAGWAYSTRSLFDLASSLCETEDIVALRDHHRSHADIIEFSNREFYENRLRIATNYERLRRPRLDEPAVRWIHHPGRVTRPSEGGALNDVEARAVVGEIARFVEQGYTGSIGVVSPFRAQANRIRDLVYSRDGFAAAATNLDFLVDTVHKFQGDERDVMIFSPVVSTGLSDGALGFLRSTPNLFNVAISRARAALVVVGDQHAALNCGVDYLSRFAAYCSELNTRTKSLSPGAQPAHGPEYPSVSNPDQVSDWERVLYKALFASGLRPVPQYPVEKYRLDLALFHGGRRLAIEVDGELYHRDWNGELCRRDQLRNLRLMELGWDVVRFWVYQVRDDLDRCVARVQGWNAAHT